MAESPATHTVAEGECLSAIAFACGFFPDTLWNHSSNRDLKLKRKNMNVLLAGDIVHIPAKVIKSEAKADAQRHRFRRKGVPEVLHLQFLRGDKPRANESFVLDIDGRLFKGVTDSQGGLSQAIPPDAGKGVLRFPDTNEEYQLELGHLDPIDELSGVQGRLRNLGYFAGAIDGQMSDDLLQAIQSFQAAQDLEPNGELTPATKDALVRVHTT